jgi:hypothetical protein
MSRLLLIAEPGLLDVFRMKLSEPAIRNRPEPAFPGVFIRGPLDGVRVIESRLLMLDHATSPPPASIIEDLGREPDLADRLPRAGCHSRRRRRASRGAGTVPLAADRRDRGPGGGSPPERPLREGPRPGPARLRPDAAADYPPRPHDRPPVLDLQERPPR